MRVLLHKMDISWEKNVEIVAAEKLNDESNLFNNSGSDSDVDEQKLKK